MYGNYYGGCGYPQTQGLTWVNSYEEASAFMVTPNSAVQLWDRNAPVVYLKSADATGMTSMRIFDLKERNVNRQAGVSREEFDALVSKVEKLLKAGEDDA